MFSDFASKFFYSFWRERQNMCDTREYRLLCSKNQVNAIECWSDNAFLLANGKLALPLFPQQ